MVNNELMTKQAILVVNDRSPHDYYKYYLVEEVPQHTQYVAEGLVVLAPETKGDVLFTSQFINPTKHPISAEEYYQAILEAELPSRVNENEKIHNMPLDAKGLVAENEYSLAAIIALTNQTPIAASMLYRGVGTTDLLIELISILPLRPSLALARLQARIRERLTRP